MRPPVVFVVGDVLLDHSVEGRATHIAPDAPVMVLVKDREYVRAGGAWNAAANVRASGATLRVYGIGRSVFEDDHGFMLRDVARTTFNPEEVRMLDAPTRRIQVKTRYLGQYGLQVMRADTPKDGPITKAEQFGLQSMIAEDAKDVGNPDVVFVADYGCGVVREDTITTLRRLFVGARIVVDPYPTTPPEFYRGADIITPNRPEADGMVRALGGGDHWEILKLVRLAAIIKNGAEPVSVLRSLPADFGVFYSDRVDVQPPSRQLVDPCGAGDAFTAYLCTALGAGVDLPDAVEIACHAGACAVSFRGVHVVTPREVVASGATLPWVPVGAPQPVKMD